MKTTKAQRQAAWLTEFVALVVAADGRHSGRIEWPSALHFYFTGLTPNEGATRYLATRLNGPEGMTQ
jgi:hypothetical protein